MLSFVLSVYWRCSFIKRPDVSWIFPCHRYTICGGSLCLNEHLTLKRETGMLQSFMRWCMKLFSKCLYKLINISQTLWLTYINLYLWTCLLIAAQLNLKSASIRAKPAPVLLLQRWYLEWCIECINLLSEHFLMFKHCMKEQIYH